MKPLERGEEDFEFNKYHLSEREFEVLKLLARGCNNQKIANELTISIYTSKAHVANILKKLSVKNRTQACFLAIKENLI